MTAVLATSLLAIVAAVALALPATWRIFASSLRLLERAVRQGSYAADATAFTLEAVPDTYRQQLARARELKGERA